MNSIVIATLIVHTVIGGNNPFADAVVMYDPAPGQFVQNPVFNNPSRALGAPVGGGMFDQDTTKVVTLGGFAGSITLKFDETVWDDPCNPYGLDAIVFGNAIYSGSDVNRRFAEAATIEISRDENGNGIADDPWFVIPGSHLSPPPADDIESQTWDDNIGNSANPPNNAAWIPPGMSVTWQTIGYRLPGLFEALIVVNPNGFSATLEGFFGYADCTPVLKLGDTDADDVVESPAISPAVFYTVADNPFMVGVDPGSCGGDAFDIGWAVDPVDGLPARLDGFDFIRVSTAVNFIAGPLGELSAEIGGVSDTSADASFFEVDATPGVDIEDLYAWYESFPMDFTGEQMIDADDAHLLEVCVRADELGDVTGR